MQLIDRIKIIPRKLIKDSRGWFIKVIDGKEENLPSYTGEVYLTMGKKGEMKGGHYHKKANEWFSVIAGEGTLFLEDIHSKERMKINVSLEKSISIFVPVDVAHGFLGTSEEDMIVLAYTDQLYEPTDTIPYKLK